MVHSYVDVAAEDVPMAWHDLHQGLDAGTSVDVLVDPRAGGADDPAERWRDVAVGAGFDLEAIDGSGPEMALRLRALHSLADTVGAGMRLLACGLNPSVHAADAGLGFVTANNRFWPAVLGAGLASVDRDPVRALRHHGLGMTDLVKRPTPRASELGTAEYRSGLGRLDRLGAWLRPGVVLFVGLAGWRAAADRSATTGWQDRGVGGCPAYVMPSTSGLNARTSLDELTEHLRRAAAGP